MQPVNWIGFKRPFTYQGSYWKGFTVSWQCKLRFSCTVFLTLYWNSSSCSSCDYETQSPEDETCFSRAMQLWPLTRYKSVSHLFFGMQGFNSGNFPAKWSQNLVRSWSCNRWPPGSWSHHSIRVVPWKRPQRPGSGSKSRQFQYDWGPLKNRLPMGVPQKSPK